MLGEKLEDLKLKDKKFNHHGAKEAVFPFDKLQKRLAFGHARASTVATLTCGVFPKVTRCKALKCAPCEPKAIRLNESSKARARREPNGLHK